MGVCARSEARRRADRAEIALQVRGDAFLVGGDAFLALLRCRAREALFRCRALALFQCHARALFGCHARALFGCHARALFGCRATQDSQHD